MHLRTAPALLGVSEDLRGTLLNSGPYQIILCSYIYLGA